MFDILDESTVCKLIGDTIMALETPPNINYGILYGPAVGTLVGAFR